jgi:hypothetical protein
MWDFIFPVFSYNSYGVSADFRFYFRKAMDIGHGRLNSKLPTVSTKNTLASRTTFICGVYKSQGQGRRGS